MNLKKLLCITFKEFILKCHYKLVKEQEDAIENILQNLNIDEDIGIEIDENDERLQEKKM